MSIKKKQKQLENLAIFLKIDIFINDSSNILIPLKGNKLFNIQISYYWFNESVSCHLIEYTKNDYMDKTDMLPNKSDYNTVCELSDNSLLVGRYHKEQNNDRRDRIVKLIKSGEKYEVALKLKVDGLVNFVVLNNNIFVALYNVPEYILCFYEINSFKTVKQQVFNPEANTIYKLNEKYMLIGSYKEIVLYDYIKYKSDKKIKYIYPINKIYIKNNRVIEFLFVNQKELKIK